MSKEKFPNFNLNFLENNSGEVPFINISNSKSNSSKNQNSKTSSNNNRIFLTHNNNSSSNSIKNQQNSSPNLIEKKIFRNHNQNQSSSEIFTFADNSLNNQFCETLLNLKNLSNASLSENKKEVEIQVKDCIDPKIATPKKRTNNNAANLINYRNKNKATQIVDNINGKNLMDNFQYMKVKVATEEKKK